MLHRVERSSDDVEYFGDDVAWSADSGQGPTHAQMDAGPSPSSQPTEVAPEDLSAQHLGQRATVKWDGEQKYDIGTIVAVSADSSAISVRLAGVDTPISFPRSRRGPANPRLYVWV